MWRTTPWIFTEVRLSEKTEKEAFSGIVNAPRIPVERLMTDLIDTLRAASGRSLSLTRYLRESESRPELVAKFIGILELVKVHLVAVEDLGRGEEGVTDMLSGVSVTLTATDEEIAGANLESGIY